MRNRIDIVCARERRKLKGNFARRSATHDIDIIFSRSDAKERISNPLKSPKVRQGAPSFRLVAFHINTFILITLRCVYIYRERSIIIVNIHVVWSSQFQFSYTLALLSSRLAHITQFLHTRMYKRTCTQTFGQRDYV